MYVRQRALGTKVHLGGKFRKQPVPPRHYRLLGWGSLCAKFGRDRAIPERLSQRALHKNFLFRVVVFTFDVATQGHKDPFWVFLSEAHDEKKGLTVHGTT